MLASREGGSAVTIGFFGLNWAIEFRPSVKLVPYQAQETLSIKCYGRCEGTINKLGKARLLTACSRLLALSQNPPVLLHFTAFVSKISLRPPSSVFPPIILDHLGSRDRRYTAFAYDRVLTLKSSLRSPVHLEHVPGCSSKASTARYVKASAPHPRPNTIP